MLMKISVLYVYCTAKADIYLADIPRIIYATVLSTSCKLTVNINCTVLGVVSNTIHSDALIYS